jgi:hypothetical protein
MQPIGLPHSCDSSQRLAPRRHHQYIKSRISTEEMPMRERINADIKQALKQGEKEKVAVLRLMNAAIQSADIELETKGKPRLEGAELVAVLQRMVKQRRDSIEQFNKGGRPGLSAKEQAEIAIIESYLPKQMDEAAIQAAIETAIRETGAQGAKDMGKVMGVLKQRYAGQMDFAKASAATKALLK